MKCIEEITKLETKCKLCPNLDLFEIILSKQINIEGILKSNDYIDYNAFYQVPERKISKLTYERIKEAAKAYVL